MAEITWKSILTKLVGGDHLTAEESEWFVDDLMQGNANPAAAAGTARRRGAWCRQGHGLPRRAAERFR